MAHLKPLNLLLTVKVCDDQGNVTLIMDTVQVERETLASLSEEECHRVFRNRLQAHADKHIVTWYDIRDDQ